MSFWIFLQGSNSFKDSFNCQSVGQHRLIEKLFLIKYNEREYFQHQCEYFFISFPVAWQSEVIPRVLKFCD